MKTFIVVSSILIILLSVFDGFSTAILMNYGNGEELNPIMDWIMSIFGVIPSLVVTRH